MLEIGIGKADITAFKRGVGMLGYGLAIQVMLDIETPLYARAFVFYDPIQKNRVAFVNAELCMINPSLKDGVVRKLQQNYPEWNYTYENLMLTAQHTHTGPSGYSLHPLYSMSSPGFVQEIYDKIVNGIVESIVLAEKNKAPGKVQVGKGDFDLETSISYNRSIAAYNLNPEVEHKISFANRHLAADKRMTLLQITDENGKPRASVNWFAVHTTNLPNNWMKVCSDNKGFAATELEESFSEDPNYVSAFAQGACGDVSARVKYNPKLDRQRGYWEGPFEDDLKSSKYNGNIQYKKAKEIISNIDTTKDLGASGVDAQLLCTDFGKINIDPEFTGGKEGCVTSPSCMGAAFLVGSVMDGPGMPELLGLGSVALSKIITKKRELFSKGENKVYVERMLRAQGGKPIMLETGRNLILGSRPKNLLLPDFADELIKNIKHFDRIGLYDQTPLAPQVLPVQAMRIGAILIVGIPFEITTIASKRLIQTIQDKVKNQGIEEVILAPYANAYNGYITTNEEYQLQMYEGGHCVFGQWSLNALQEKCSKAITELLKPAAQRQSLREAEPDVYSEDYIQAFTHFQGDFYKGILKKEQRKENRRLKIEARKDRNGASY
ncbi:MAG TPA: neutral/alkaline non-lysosomal ceramidase N-terminal domain-containing protein [Chitinophagales bacterium]|nr:neutral/alkaline non-lysosomal ceramidase N-terminal domain-containing protein [Chitinophagales bacterium]